MRCLACSGISDGHPQCELELKCEICLLILVLGAFICLLVGNNLARPLQCCVGRGRAQSRLDPAQALIDCRDLLEHVISDPIIHRFGPGVCHDEVEDVWTRARQTCRRWRTRVGEVGRVTCVLSDEQLHGHGGHGGEDPLLALVLLADFDDFDELCRLWIEAERIRGRMLSEVHEGDVNRIRVTVRNADLNLVPRGSDVCSRRRRRTDESDDIGMTNPMERDS